MLGCWYASTMRGVRMHCEQSSVGNVSLSWLMWPPMDASFSMRTTSWPPSAMSSAAWMPAMPPPMTRARLVTGILMTSSGLLCLTFSMIVRPMSMALAVASSLSSWIQEQCSRMLAISHMNLLRPAWSAARRKVFSCMCGEQAAMTTPVRLFSSIAFLTRAWPGSEHMYL